MSPSSVCSPRPSLFQGYGSTVTMGTRRSPRMRVMCDLISPAAEGFLCRPGHSGSAEGPEEGDQDNRNTVARRVHPPRRSRCHTPGPQVLTLVEQDDCDDEQEIDGGTEQRQVKVSVGPAWSAS